MHCYLTEFDSSPGIIEPGQLIQPVPGFPRVVIATFTGELLHQLAEMPGARQIASLHNANTSWPVLALPWNGVEIGVSLAPVGAPTAVGAMEELIAMGARSLLFFGSCGVLDRKLPDGGILLPTAALRDEGTSFHYAPPDKEISLAPQGVETLEKVLTRMAIPFQKGKVWTTDAFYRETPEKMARRKAEGCIAVEMECAALTACAAFRQVSFSQFLYAADSLDGEAWDVRGLHHKGLHIRDQLLNIALEAALGLHKQLP